MQDYLTQSSVDINPLALELQDPNVAERAEESRVLRAAKFISNLPSRAYGELYYNAAAFQIEPYQYMKRTAQVGIVGAELSPLNEALRYGALAYALENTSGGAVVGALVLGATTFAVEAPAALSTASLLETERSNKALTKVNNFVDKRFGRNFKMNPAVEAGVAMTGGSAVVLVEKHREDQSRSLQKNRKHGLFTAGWMSAYFTAEGAFIGANSTGGNVLNAQTIGATLLALGATATGAKMALRTQNKENGSPRHRAKRKRQ